MNILPPSNCDFGQQPNPVFASPRHAFSGRIFSYHDFDKVIKDTLDNDAVIQNVKQTAPYFTGSKVSFDNIISQNLYYQYLKAYLDTRMLYKRMESIRFHYLVDCVLRVLANDCLAPDPFTGEILRVTIDENHPYSTKAQNLVDKFMDKFQIDRIIENVITEAIFYGEYSFTLQTNKGTDKGEFQGDSGVEITRILDANLPGTLFGVWEAAHPQYYFRLQKNVNMMTHGPLERLEPSSVWSINIFPQAIRFSIGNGMMLFNDDSNRIAQFVKVGQPLFHAVYPKIIELEAFEQAQYQKRFGDIRRRGIIGIQAPSGMDLDQQRDFCKYYEAMLNENHGATNLNSVYGLEQISAQMSSLSMVRAIPQQPDRGKMEVVDLKVAVDNILEEIIDRRKVVLESLGFPFEYVFGVREGGKVNIRQYVQYMRRVIQVQNGASWSTKRLLKTFLATKGIQISQKQIDVHFFKSVNVSELDSMQALDTTMQYVKSFDDFIMPKIQDPLMNKYINVSNVMRFYDKVLSQTGGMGNIIKVPEKDDLYGDQAMAQVQGTGDGEVPSELQDMSNAIQSEPSIDMSANQQGLGWNTGWPKGVFQRVDGLPPNVRMSGGDLPGNVRMCS